MSVAELSTAVRLGTAAAGRGATTTRRTAPRSTTSARTVTRWTPCGFPDTDLAAIARGFGCQAITVRTTADLAPLAAWLDAPRGLFVVDAKVSSARGSWWLEEAFRGH